MPVFLAEEKNVVKQTRIPQSTQSSGAAGADLFHLRAETVLADSLLTKWL